MRLKATITLVLSVFFILGVSDVSADIPTVKATGTLTSIEEDGSVIIDEKGYEVDPSLRVINSKGKSVSLHSLPLPAKIRFEYRQSKTGFIIMLIEEVKTKKIRDIRGRR